MPRPKKIKLTPETATVLKGRSVLHQRNVAALQAARWYNRKRRHAAALETYGVLNDLLLVIGGQGAVLSYESGEPVVTRI